MGRPKQLLPWAGSSLVGNAVAAALGVPRADVYVVLGAHAGLIRTELHGLDVTFIDNPAFATGLGSSIAAAVRYLFDTPATDYAELTFMLADQPAVTSEYLALLLRRTRSTERIVATEYGEHVGVPAVFPVAYAARLGKLSGDAGAKQLLNDPAIFVDRVAPPVDLFDIDTPEDYRRHEGDQKRN